MGAIEVFSARRKMGGEEFSAKYRSQLEKEVDESYENYKLHNDSKNIFKAANTPITLAAVAMLCYVTSQVFAMIALYPFANLLNLLMMITFLLLGTWAYVRYSGNMTEIGQTIDSIASALWESGLQPLFAKVATEGSQFAARQAVERLNSTTVPPNFAPGSTPGAAAAMSAKKYA